MALIDCALLLDLHPMVGVDIHDCLLPPPAPSPPAVPHACFQCLGLLTTSAKTTAKTVDKPSTVLAWTRPIILRGSDIGAFIPHIPVPPVPNLKLLIIIPGSGSVSEFGCFSVHAKGQPVATAFPAIYGTLNLNCQGPSIVPVPMPTGIVVAPNTVFAGMSLGDIIASIVSMYLDIILQTLINLAWGGYGKLFEKLAYGSIAKIVAESELARTAIGDVTGLLLGMFLYGSPIGYAPPWKTPGSTIGDFKDDQLQEIADHYNDPSVETH